MDRTIQKTQCSRTHPTRTNLRESGRDDGRKQCPSALPDLGNIVDPGSAGEGVAFTAEVLEEPWHMPSMRLRRPGRGAESASCVREQWFSCPRAFLGGLAIRDPACQPQARGKPA